MKLKLNRTLRAALIAAIATVGFTLPQAEAANTVISNASQSAAVLVEGGITLSNITSSMVKASGNEATPGNTDYRNSFTYTPANIGNGGGTATYTLNFTITGIADGETAQGMAIDFFTLNGGGSPQNAENGYKATVALTMSGQEAPVYNAEHTILTYSGTNTYTGSAYEGNPAITPVTQASVSTLSLADVEWKTGIYTLTIAFAQDSGHTGGCFGGVGNVAFLCVPPASTWQGTEEQTWEDEEAWSGGVPTSSIPAVFDANGQNTTVNINSEAAAATVTVSGKDYTFNVQAGGSLAVASELSVTSNHLTIQGGLVTAGSLTVAEGASLTVGEDASLKVSNGQKELMMGTAVDNKGTFVLTTNVSLGNGESTQMGGTLAIQGATVTIGSGEGTTASIASFSHVSLDDAQITVNAQNAAIKGVSVANGKTGTIRVEDMKNSPNTVALNGVTQVDGTLNLTNNWNSSFTIEQLSGAGTLNQPAGGQQEMLLTINSLKDFTGTLSLKHDKGSDAININTGTTAVNFNTLELAIGGHTANFTLGANTGIGLAKLTSGTLALSGADTHTLTLGGLEGGATITGLNNLVLNVASGEHVYTGTFAVAGQITKTGAGSQTITGTALHHTILAQGGTLVLNGNYEIKDIAEGEHQTVYVDASDQVNENGGFQKNEGKLTVYSVNTEAGANLVDTNAVFTYNGVNVTSDVVNGEYTLPSAPDMSTLYVKKGNLAFAAYKAKAGENLTTVSLADGTAIDMNEAASINLVMENGANATVNATAATTISSLTGTDATLNITGDSVVTLAAASSMTSAINIGTADGSSSVTVKLNNGQALGGASNAITVYTGATLDVNGKDAPGVGLLYTVTLAGGTLANNGAIVSYGSRQLISNLVVSADSTVDAANKDFGVVNANYAPTTIVLNANLEKVGSNGFHICNATFSGTGKLIISDGTLSIDKAKNYSSTFANDIDMNGGTLDGAIKLAGAITITATDEGSAITANIKNEGNNITFAGDNDLTIRGVISGNGGLTKNDEGTLTLNGAQTYTGATVVNSGKLVVNGTIASQEVTLGENASIENKGTGPITLSNVDEHLMQVENTGAGELTLKNASGMLSVVELTIAADSTVSFYDKAETPAEGTITVTETLTSGGGTLLANLTIVGGAEDAFLWDLGGTAMTLGSTLTLVTTDGLIQLDDATMANIADMQEGDFYELVLEKEGSSLNYEGSNWWDEVFTRSYGGENALALVGAYQVGLLDNGNFGVTKTSNVPEPTTGTLSLLALAALAARRRRK